MIGGGDDVDRDSADVLTPQGTSASETKTAKPAVLKRSNATRLFGYDVFISFALGPAPRGTQSYASDLARRLRERDFTVFFSQDEAPPGEQLDSTLRTALHSSKNLVVIANHDTLQEPRWVRREVEEFRSRHPERPVIPISVGGALDDLSVAESAKDWLGFHGRIWEPETQEAVEHGIASDALVDRLALAMTRRKSNVIWRWVVRGVVASLGSLAIALGVATWKANESAERARAELRRATALRQVAESQIMLSGTHVEADEQAFLKLMAAHRIMPSAATDGGLLHALVERRGLRKLIPTEISGFAVAISTDCTRIVSGSNDGTLRLWDASTGKLIGTPLEGHDQAVTCVGFSADGALIVSGFDDGTLRLWDANSGKPIGERLAGHELYVNHIAISPDGAHIVSASYDQYLRLWDTKKGRPSKKLLEEHGAYVTSVAFSPDSTRLISGHDNGILHLWDVKTGSMIRTLIKGHKESVKSVAFSPDGMRIVSGSSDSSLRLWDAKTGQPIWTALERHKGGVTRVAFSPDGTRIVSAYAEGKLRLWDAKSGQPIGTPLSGHKGYVMIVAFSSDAGSVISIGADLTLRLWNSKADQPFSALLKGSESGVRSVAYGKRRPGSESARHLRGTRKR